MLHVYLNLDDSQYFNDVTADEKVISWAVDAMGKMLMSYIRLITTCVFVCVFDE